MICQIEYYIQSLCNLYFFPYIYSDPKRPVSGIVIMIQEDDQTVNVSWTPLSYAEARGFPFYIVSYTSEDGQFTGSVNTTNSSVLIVIQGLDLHVLYVFTVSVTTGNGNSAGQEATGMWFIGDYCYNRTP